MLKQVQHDERVTGSGKLLPLRLPCIAPELDACLGSLSIENNRILSAMTPLALSACYNSPSDLLGVNANTIVRMDPIFNLSSTIYYALGSGKAVELCKLTVKADLKGPCNSVGTMSVERTSRGNYIVQFGDAKGYHYGIWFRSDESPRGKTGLQCFAWLGDGIVGKTDMSTVWVKYGRTEIFSKISSAVRKVATEAPINRQQLLKIASIYENTLSPYGEEDVNCLGERTWVEPKSVEIVGDNRNLQQFVRGPIAPR